MKDKYPAVDYVTLAAVPSARYVFDSWSGQTDGIADLHQNPVTFQMGDDLDNDRVLTANFIQSDLRYTVTAIVEPSGAGSVSLNGKEEQPADGYPVNETISVFASPQTGYVFSRWMGDLAGNEVPRTLLVSEDKSITAVFRPTVAVYCSPSYGGSYALEPESSNGYATGTEVTVTAKAAKGYRFDAWEGDASGSDKSITITVDEAKTLTARFLEESPRRWWLWAIVGVAGLFSALILVRLVYAKMNRRAFDEPER